MAHAEVYERLSTRGTCGQEGPNVVGVSPQKTGLHVCVVSREAVIFLRYQWGEPEPVGEGLQLHSTRVD